MTHNPRKIEPYIRILELQSVITEEWGETVKELNNYLWKGNNISHLEKAEKELQQIVSPLLELEELLKLTRLRKGNNSE